MRKTDDILLQKDETLHSLVNSFNLLSVALDSTSDAVVVLENDRIVLCNCEFRNLFGFKKSDNPNNHSILNFIAQDFQNDFREKQKVAAENINLSQKFESNFLKTNSNEFSAETTIKSQMVAEKQFFFITLRDIKERKSLLDQINKLSNVIDNSPSTVIITDPRGIVEYTNPRFTETTGYFFEEVFGKRIDLIGDEDSSEIRLADLWNLIRNGNFWRGEIRSKRKNGEFYWERALISPINDDNDDLEHIIIIKEDLTSKKEMELELKRALDCAEEANKLKFNLLSNMSHELRTPLTGIIGFSSLLRDELEDSENVEITDKILKSSKRLLVTLNSVLNLAEIESGNYPICLTEFNLSSYTKYFLINYDKTAAEKNLSFSFETLDEEINAVGDENLFKQILMHIVDNAIKFTNQGGVKIEISSREDEQNSPLAVVNVIDTGIGICPEDQSKIFREFRQLSEGIRRNFEGSGLGLSVAKKMIKLMKGDIIVESGLNQGSVFTIVLPGTKKNAFNSDLTLTVKSDNDTVRRIPVIRNNNANQKFIMPAVLSIEDNLLNSELVNLFLKNIYKVDCANNYDQALEKLRTNKYDALLIDINLGNGPSGIDIAKEIRNLPGYETTPLIALTGYALLKDEKYLLSEGFNYYLHKPFDREDLIKILNKALKLL
ncbi:MAG: PAS domain S-box protein [Melioribacteraceae bacterium]|nr:PAS domain S-box protein [Melioribacteraceae bacterium]